METLDKGKILVLGGKAQDGERFHHTTQKGPPLKLMNYFWNFSFNTSEPWFIEHN